MELSTQKKKEIIQIWLDYQKSLGNTSNTPEKVVFEDDFHKERLSAITNLKEIINTFLKGEISLFSFKTEIDSYNKRHNYWGFTAIKGQMFFNQLTKASEDDLDKLSDLIKKSIVKPKDINSALQIIDVFEKYTVKLYANYDDKRKAPKPSSVGYFLSYFWQIEDYIQWPIIYTSITEAFKDIGIWVEKEKETERYNNFYSLYLSVKQLLEEYTKSKLSNWDVEHCFWFYYNKETKSIKPTIDEEDQKITSIEQEPMSKASFDLYQYVVPRVANLIKAGETSDKSASAKGFEFEKLVAEVFKFLDFNIESLGQGTGRNPDIIIKYREENIAFIVDAKAYSTGYSMGLDDRAFREYINHYTPKLQKDGYKKLGFIVVSNSFKSDYTSFINDITWNTDIKRFVLLTTEALLYFLAYKTKDKLSLSIIIEKIISLGNHITAKDVISGFEDI